MPKGRLIRAVYERDLDEFLENAGLLDAIHSGRLVCAICGNKIEKEEISRFIIHNNVISAICLHYQCSTGKDEKNGSD